MSIPYFIADTHWGHKNICQYRPFDSPEIHNKLILDNIVYKVDKRDTLWLLGDIFFDAELAKDIMDELSYIRNIRWILGNHDGENTERQGIVSEALSRGWKVYSMFSYKGFWLSHAPIHSLELRGKPNIHGHVHDKTIPDRDYINVSCENTSYAPVSLTKIQDTLAFHREYMDKEHSVSLRSC